MTRNNLVLLFLVAFLAACGPAQEPPPASVPEADRPLDVPEVTEPFEVEAERFADLRILRYQVPGFESLDLRDKTLLYYLTQAGLSGRDIIYDQKYRYNLRVRRTLEEIVKHYPGDRETSEFQALLEYTKRVWVANGIHHHYGYDKFVPGFSFEDLVEFVEATPGEFPTRPGQSVDELLAELQPVMFDPTADARLVNRVPGEDPVATSAVNFYSNVTQAEVEAFYDERRDPNDETPVWHGLNSRLADVDGDIVEQAWHVGGLYTEAIERVVYWLEQALTVTENNLQHDAIEKLIAYFRSGDLEDWDEYNVAWVADTESTVDAINGFVEVYNDPVGLRGSYEAVVQFVDPIATQRIETLAAEAQWFEDNAPIPDEYKKPDVTGITGRAINIVGESGDASPTTPVGINLPNSDWIRREHGSKSVALANIQQAYDQVSGGTAEEFAWDAAEVERFEQFNAMTGILTTDMHEVIGHASGQLAPGVGAPNETLGIYMSPLEEGRADLIGLYYILDPKLVELGLMPSVEAGHTEYDWYIRNGLMQQLNRIEPGNDIEEAHMRNRQLISAWAYEMGRDDDVIERRERDGKTFFVVNDYDALREIFGRQLRELQRIKSEGDFVAIRNLIETYAVKVDPELHAEVRARYAALNIPSYSAFINAKLVPVEQNGEIVDVRVEYPEDFTEQMLEYAEEYSFLPTWNF
ncbi:MAG: dihydrofolate reductase [Gammaproteobacteria bacterium]|nr:dihydrofolate reductase [Gammaproteobacteria bacterium]